MYPIATEKGLNKDGKMEYNVFGVRLESSKSRIRLLRELSMKYLLFRDVPLFRKILNENLRGEIIPEDMLSAYIRTHLEPFDWATVKPQDIASNGITLVSLYGYIDKARHFEEIRYICEGIQEFLESWNKSSSLIHYNYPVLDYLETTHNLKLEMRQDTPSRTMIGSSKELTSLYSNLSIAKANAIILMLLTGNMNYIDINGEVKPIVIDGVINGRRSVSSEEARLKYTNR